MRWDPGVPIAWGTPRQRISIGLVLEFWGSPGEEVSGVPLAELL